MACGDEGHGARDDTDLNEVREVAEEATTFPTSGELALPCAHVAWIGPDAPIQRYSCEPSAGGGFDCVCDGASATSELSECYEALGEACGVDPTVSTFCPSYAPQAVCWPTASPIEWLCRCDDSSPAVPADGPSCESAAFGVCATPCEAESVGRCWPKARADADHPYSYECECDYYPGRTRTIYDVAICEGALSQCIPKRHGCANYDGYCDFSPEGFVCACLNGRAGTQPFGEYGLECRAAVAEFCGDGDVSPGGCADERAVGDAVYRGDCRSLGGRGGDPHWQCNCQASGPDFASTNFGTSTQVSCLDALAEQCFPEP